MARYRFNFWLDCDKDDELLLAEQIDSLKQERSFTQTVRDGIRLICDLRKGSFDVLFEIFPELRKHLREEEQGNLGVSSDEINAMREQVARLENLLIQQASQGNYLMSEHIPLTQPRAPKTLNSTTFNLPTFADEDDTAELVVKKDTRTNSAHNFITSMLNLQQ